MLAGLVANCWIMFSAGTPGTDGRITGSAAAEALSATAAEHSPAAAIALAANNFAKRDIWIHSLDCRSLKPKVSRCWSYSSDTCGIYATVTGAMGIGYPDSVGAAF
jgi:hypothetical protein